MRQISPLFALAALVCVGALYSSSALAQTRVTVVLQEGDIPPGGDGSAVLTLDNPFTTPTGRIGFAGRSASGDHFVWSDTSVVWIGANAPVGTTLTLSTGQTDTMGHDDAGHYVYGPSVGGEVGVWTELGLLARETEAAPGFGAGDTHNFIYDPTMTATGAVTWVSSIQFVGTSTASDARALYRSTDRTVAGTTVVLRSGDMVADAGGAMFAIEGGSTGIDTDYSFSTDGSHYIVVVDLATGSTLSDGGVVVDGALVAQEATTAAGMDFLDNFDQVVINNAGNYLVSGDTDGATTGDEFILYNGVVAISEGDTVGGVVLASTASVQSIGLDDLGGAAHHWTYSGGETLFYASDASSLAATSFPALSRGDTVDVDGDGMADATVTDLNASTSTPGVHLANDGTLVVWVDLDYDGDGIGETEAIISFQPAFCGDGAIDAAEVCDDAGESATCNSDCTAAACGDGVLNVTAGEQCDDAGESATCDADCSEPVCGDGLLNAAAGEACDDGGESAACNIDCTEAVCGDLTVNPTAGEDCDEGGVLSMTCDPDCTAPECGDGFHNVLVGEYCDEGAEAADCDADCSVVYCGDGVANGSAGEACDTGGETAVCNFDCTPAVCGDGLVNAMSGEECDAGSETASCDTDCTVSACGDGMVNSTSGETCDGGGETDTCDVDCTAAECGDGLLNAAAGETCEDGNVTDGDGCSAACLREEVEPPYTPLAESEDGGCGCSVPGASSQSPLPWLALLFGVFVTRVRRRRRR